MTYRLTYRIAAVLLLLFALGHQLGFRQVDPAWNAGDVVRAMQSTRFVTQGFTRTYWQFFSGFGFLVTALLLFSAVFAWSVGNLKADLARALAPVLVSFAVCYVAVAVLTWMNFFIAPGVFATLVAAMLAVGAYQATRVSSPSAPFPK